MAVAAQRTNQSNRAHETKITRNAADTFVGLRAEETEGIGYKIVFK
jgi:hypothetical protein